MIGNTFNQRKRKKTFEEKKLQTEKESYWQFEE